MIPVGGLQTLTGRGGKTMPFEFFKPAMGIIAFALMFAPARAAVVSIYMEVRKATDNAGNVVFVWVPAGGFPGGAPERLNLLKDGDKIKFFLTNFTGGPHFFTLDKVGAAAGVHIVDQAVPNGSQDFLVDASATGLMKNMQYIYYCSIHPFMRGGIIATDIMKP
jgi:hypothetical protein